ncbi:MAG: hypothetical protein ACXVPN_08775 [Bacteroidia bacterium]
MRALLNIIFLGLMLSSCSKKQEVGGCPALQEHDYSGILKKFMFKQSSFWVYINTTTNLRDSMIIKQQTNSNNFSDGAARCTSSDKWYYYISTLNNNLIPWNDLELQVTSKYNGIFMGVPTNGYSYGFFDGTEGDSITMPSGWNKSFLEKKFPSLTVNNKTYSNVFQIFYSPPVGQIRRIWWAPSVGMVKFEFKNQNTSLIEICELDTFKVSLY